MVCVPPGAIASETPSMARWNHCRVESVPLLHRWCASPEILTAISAPGPIDTRCVTLTHAVPSISRHASGLVRVSSNGWANPSADVPAGGVYVNAPPLNDSTHTVWTGGACNSPSAPHATGSPAVSAAHGHGHAGTAAVNGAALVPLPVTPQPVTIAAAAPAAYRPPSDPYVTALPASPLTDADNAFPASSYSRPCPAATASPTQSCTSSHVTASPAELAVSRFAAGSTLTSAVSCCGSPVASVRSTVSVSATSSASTSAEMT